MGEVLSLFPASREYLVRLNRSRGKKKAPPSSFSSSWGHPLREKKIRVKKRRSLLFLAGRFLSLSILSFLWFSQCQAENLNTTNGERIHTWVWEILRITKRSSVKSVWFAYIIGLLSFEFWCWITANPSPLQRKHNSTRMNCTMNRDNIFQSTLRYAAMSTMKHFVWIKPWAEKGA